MVVTTPYLASMLFSTILAILATYWHVKQAEAGVDARENRLLWMGVCLVPLAGTHDIIAGFR